MNKALLVFHCKQNTGYAIGRLEKIFYASLVSFLDGNKNNLFISYTELDEQGSKTLPASFTNFIQLDTSSESMDDFLKIKDFISQNKINLVFSFDEPPKRSMHRALRQGGVKTFISYWGAPMSSLMPWWKLQLKKLELKFRPYGPDLYIFESNGMLKTATHGRGIKQSKTRLCYLGVDIDRFSPPSNSSEKSYPYLTFNIPKNKKIFVFSGHMEPRKGPQVIMQAANYLIDSHSSRDDWHFLLLGNTKGDESRLRQQLSSQKANESVSFGGYREDIERIIPGCYAGVIASCGWDSLTCSSLEMQAAGLPLILSDLPGLNEAIIDNETGLLFPPSQHEALANKMCQLIDNHTLHHKLSTSARERIQRAFTDTQQIDRLVEILSNSTQT